MARAALLWLEQHFVQYRECYPRSSTALRVGLELRRESETFYRSAHEGLRHPEEFVNETLLAILKDLEVFRGLGDATLASIVREAERVAFKPGQSIIKDGMIGDGAFVIAGGEADVVDGEEVLEPVIPGSLVGEMAMLIEHEHRITVVARSPVKALKIPRAAIHALMLQNQTLTEHFVDRIGARLTRVAIELNRVDQALALAAEPAQA